MIVPLLVVPLPEEEPVLAAGAQALRMRMKRRKKGRMNFL
jgi:hypothetical protein